MFLDPELTFAAFVEHMGASERTVQTLINHEMGNDHFRTFSRQAVWVVAAALAAAVPLLAFRIDLASAYTQGLPTKLALTGAAPSGRREQAAPHTPHCPQPAHAQLAAPGDHRRDPAVRRRTRGDGVSYHLPVTA
ncbi:MULTISPECIES: hypothetical protein [Sphingomonas]|uniref:Uncharacterized protein n=1 Tax=Sphingomonas trueperi TaxID=53317 RepID=A0A7X6BEL3_9SPHN|nr:MULTISPECIES: hypothetical protein [Sphingomonas]NJB99798.1 hypothetical protein [Sphingomonas trueperi]